MQLTPIPLPPKFIELCFSIKQAGGIAYLVGGIVRDHVLCLPPKDIDIEVHQLDTEHLLSILKQYGSPKGVGKSFGIWKLKINEDEIDVSIPQDRKSGDLIAGLTESCRRRDLRINSIAYDPTTENYHDPFNGLTDINNKILQATDPKYFEQDPLRVFRVAQFAARFQFSVAPALINLCQQQDISDVASERVLSEFEKCWIKSNHPSIGIEYLIQFQAIEKYFPTWPGIDDPTVLKSVDIGKQFCTKLLGWNMGLFWSILLQQCSEIQALTIMERLKIFTYHSFNVREAVLTSLKHTQSLSTEESVVVRNHASEDFRLDFLCAISMIIFPTGQGNKNLLQAQKEGIDRHPLPKLVQGRDLLPYQITGRDIGECLRFVRQGQLNGTIHTKQEALNMVQNWKEIC
jgi:tRNA nucleotidyltransferase/poly(A) polymerase